MTRVAPGRPVLLYLVTEDWYFLSHRLAMAKAAQRAGYAVHVATHVGARRAEIEALGFVLHPLEWQRGSLNPFAVVSIVRQVRALYRRLRPDLVHHVGLQPSIVGSLAAAGLPPVRLNALAGLGYGFSSKKLKARLLRPLLATFVRTLMNNERSAVLVQNPDDRAAVEKLGVAAERVFLVAGSGVDTEKFAPLPEPPGATTVAFVGRLLQDKGVRELIAAHELLTQRKQSIRLLIAGEPDPANPASISPAEIEVWRRRPGVELLGHVADIRSVWAAAHIAVLPSWREGLPMSLLEAAACGRPIVATDVPGCREIARAEVNALLVPVEDPQALAGAIERLARDRDLRERFGAAGRKLVEQKFSSACIGRETVALYDRLLAALPRARCEG